MAKLASLVIDVRTNTAKFNQSMDRAQKKMAAFSKTAKNLTVVLLTLGGAAVIGSLIKKNLELADAIGKSADATDFSVEAFQELSFAASQAGVDTAQFTSNMTAFVKRVGEARSNTGPLVSFLKKYDETLLLAIQSTKSQEEALNLLANAVQKASTRTDEAAIANSAFGRSGITMVNTLRNGAAGMEEVRQRARDLGLVMSEGLVRGAENANDRFEQMEKFISIKFTKTIVENAKAIEDMATAIITLVDWLGKGFTALNDFGTTLGNQLGKIDLTTHSTEKLLLAMTGFGALLPGILIAESQFAESTSLINEKINDTIKLLRTQQDIVEDDGILGFGGSTDDEISAARDQIAVLNEELLKLRYIKQRIADQDASAKETDEEFDPEESARVQLKVQEDESIQLLNEEHLAKLTEQEIEHWDKLKKQWERGQTDRQRFNRSSFKQQTQTILGEMVNLTQGVAQQDKRLFEINKAAATANAVINTISGVTKTLGAYPYPWNIALAALSAAAGYAQVQAIQSTSFGGGGSAPSLSGSGGGGSTVNTVPLTDIGEQQGVAQQVDITLNGTGYSKDDVRELIDSINEEIGDGVELRTS